MKLPPKLTRQLCKATCDNCREFTEKMIPLVMDDFKSRE